MSKPTKADLNKLAKHLYGETAFCEYQASGKRGWLLHPDHHDTNDKLISLGANVDVALAFLQAKLAVGSVESVEPVEPVESVKPVEPAIEPTQPKPSVVPYSEVVKTLQAPADLDKRRRRNWRQLRLALAFLCEQFPHCFVPIGSREKVRALALGTGKQVKAAVKDKLPAEIGLSSIGRALHFYCHTPQYQKMLKKAGNPRINLAGEVVGEVTAEEVKLHYETKETKAQAVKSPAKPMPKQSKALSLSPPVLDELVTGKMEFKIKISELPTDIEILENKWVAFVIETESDQVKVTIRPKTWKKWQKAATDYPAWVAAISGRLGPEIDGGFELLEPGVQIFEKKPKEPKESKDKSL